MEPGESAFVLTMFALSSVVYCLVGWWCRRAREQRRHLQAGDVAETGHVGHREDDQVVPRLPALADEICTECERIQTWLNGMVS